MQAAKWKIMTFYALDTKARHQAKLLTHATIARAQKLRALELWLLQNIQDGPNKRATDS